MNQKMSKHASNRNMQLMIKNKQTKKTECEHRDTKETPDRRATKLITHVDSPQTDILMLKEDNYKNKRI